MITSCIVYLESFHIRILKLCRKKISLTKTGIYTDVSDIRATFPLRY